MVLISNSKSATGGIWNVLAVYIVADKGHLITWIQLELCSNKNETMHKMSRR